MASKKYLFYDNIVISGGLGHILCNYAYGLNLADELNLEFLPIKMALGHGLKDAEPYLGLPQVEEKRNYLLKERSQEIHHIPYDASKPHPSICTVRWPTKIQNFFRNRYVTHGLKLQNWLKHDCANIALSIRRGDILQMKSNFRSRLRPDSFYRNSIKKILSIHNFKKYFLHICSDGNRKKAYVNEKGKKTSLKELFPSYHKNASFYLSEMDTLKTFLQFQNCINADVFLGSISGFSEVISTYRSGKNCYLPHHENFKKLIQINQSINYEL